MRETVPRLAELIESRRRELGMDPKAFIEATGLTREGLAPLRRGERRRYQERLTLPVCRVLRWRSDSIALILDGGDPVPLDDDVNPTGEVVAPEEMQQFRLEALQEMQRLARLVKELRDEVDELKARGRPDLGSV